MADEVVLEKRVAKVEGRVEKQGRFFDVILQRLNRIEEKFEQITKSKECVKLL